MLIPPKNKDLEKIAMGIFLGPLQMPSGDVQHRYGHYVINSHTIPNEVLVLDTDNNVVDGYCGFPMYQLPWKNRPFLIILNELNDNKYEHLVKENEWRTVDYTEDETYMDQLRWEFSAHYVKKALRT
jgi:hypothetical protein